MHKLLMIGAALGLGAASPAIAGNAGFNATFSNTNPPAAPGGRCPGLTVSIANIAPFFATGSSNFGAFTATQSHCLDSGPPLTIGATDVGYYDGLFAFTFADGDVLSGTYEGTLSNGGAFGIIDNLQQFTITGGSGDFAGATGTLEGIGQLKFTSGPPSATLAIEGTILAPAVVEPATWGMMLIGFGAIGSAIRRPGKAAVRFG